MNRKLDFISPLGAFTLCFAAATALALASCASNQTQLESMLRSPASEPANVSAKIEKPRVAVAGFISPSLKCFVRRRDMHIEIIGPLPASKKVCQNSAPIVDGNFWFNCELQAGQYRLVLLNPSTANIIDSKTFQFTDQARLNFDLESCPKANEPRH